MFRTLCISSCALLFCLTAVAGGAEAAIFGDGNPKNGPEDDRRPILIDDRTLQPLRATGTIECDGVVRGSGTVLDVSDFADANGWTVIATVAHIFFEPNTHRRRSNCIFVPYLGREYRRQFDLNDAVMGDYIPWAKPKLTDFKDDWAFIALGARLDRFGAAMKPITPGMLQKMVKVYGPTTKGAAIVGYNESERKQTVSLGCQLVKLPDRYGNDLQLRLYFTNCDAKPGASGGGVSVKMGANHYLIGMYAGHYWKSQSAPGARQPTRPSDGDPFHPRANANIFRVFDGRMVEAIQELLER